MYPCLISAPLLNDSYFFLALGKHYGLEITNAKIKEDRGLLRLDCKFKGTKENIEAFERKSELIEYYMVEIDKLIQKGPMAPPTFLV